MACQRAFPVYQSCVMYNRKVWQRSLDHPKISLILWFTVWKVLMLCIAVWSPGPGYDTSTTLLHSNQDIIINAVLRPELASKPWMRKFIRWDAIYYTQIAQHGYVWEQEWAFGWGFTKLLALVDRGEFRIGLGWISRTEVYSSLV